MADTLEALLEEAGGDERHSAMGLIDVVGDLIEDYEAEHHPMPEVSGVQALKFLMEQHGLKQGDLPEVGSQGGVSEILAGKRELNARQIRELARRFAVSSATFVQQVELFRNTSSQLSGDFPSSPLNCAAFLWA